MPDGEIRSYVTRPVRRTAAFSLVSLLSLAAIVLDEYAAVPFVLVAVGAGANPVLTQSDPELELTSRGYIKADPKTGKTAKKGVWAGGDIVTGQATVILAMGAGRMAADSIDDYLRIGW